MGACLSSAADSIHKSTFALVVSTKGELRQYPSPIFVSEVLRFEKPPSSSGIDVFLCNSDTLYFDQHIPALDSEDELDAGQLYFVLPKTMLGRHLSASDMAALAVKASLALDSNDHVVKKKKNGYNYNNAARISPSSGSSVIRKKMPRCSSKKSRLAAVRSFRLPLSTIYENEGCDDHQL